MKTSSKKSQLRLLLFCTLLLISLTTIFWQNDQRRLASQLTEQAQVAAAINIIDTGQEDIRSEKKVINKEIKVANPGKEPVFVRVSFEEVFRYLAAGGEEQNLEYPLTQAAAQKIAVDADLPVLENYNPDELTAAGYLEVTAKVQGLAAVQNQYGGQIHVWLKKINQAQPSAEALLNFETSYEAKFFYLFNYGGQTVAQKMSGELHLAASKTQSSATWTFTVANLRYAFYPNGYRFLTKNWAKSQLSSPYADSSGTHEVGYTLLGYQGKRNGEPFDYRITASGLGSNYLLPPTISTFPNRKGLYPNQQHTRFPSFIFSEPKHTTEDITIEFASLSDYSDIKPNTWVYNPDDGWFYYAAKLDQFHQATDTIGVTASLVKSIEYSSRFVNNPFYHYELLPKAEVVLVSDASALTQIFKLSEATAQKPASKAILTYLTELM